MRNRTRWTPLFAALGLLSSLGGVNAATNSQDRMFLVKAAQINIAEVKTGQLALTRAVNGGVRDYAQGMITGHSRANMQLKRLAAQKGVRLPNDTDLKHRALNNRLAKRSGTNFDNGYMSAMVKGHKEAITLFNKEVATGRDADVKAWAKKMLPTLRHHLHMAQQLSGHPDVQRTMMQPPGAAMRRMPTEDAGEGGGDAGGSEEGRDGGTDTPSPE